MASNIKIAGATFEDVPSVEFVTDDDEVVRYVPEGDALDTSDATATEDDIAVLKTAYVNGEKIEGRLPDYRLSGAVNPIFDDVRWGKISRYAYGVLVNGHTIYKGIIGDNFPVSTSVAGNEFGDATPEDVVVGKTFTSNEGLKIEGKGIFGDYVEILYDAGGTTVSKYSPSDIFDMCENGEARFKGLLPTSWKMMDDGSILITVLDIGVFIEGIGMITESCIITENKEFIFGEYEESHFFNTLDADATPEDIVAPKTAYANGEKIEGTLQKHNLITSEITELNGNTFTISNGQFQLGNVPTMCGSDPSDMTTFTEGVCKPDSFVGVTGLASLLGNATAKDITSGKTALTKNGFVTGTAENGGLAYVTELYSGDINITYTSTSSGTAKTIYGIDDPTQYPMTIVIIENCDDSDESGKFIRSNTVMAYNEETSVLSKFGAMQYRNANNVLTNNSSTTYGLWGYTMSKTSITIRGRCSTSYFNSLTGTYKIRVLGIKF